MTSALATVPQVTDPRELALLKAVGLDRVSAEQRELAINIASRYDLDLMLKHIVMIDGRPYITRDGLLHIAHRSGVLDGIETTDPVLADGFWRATCSVYRKDMSRPFTYSGRYPEKGQNAKYAPEMATKVAESMSLRRAFDIAAPSFDERWDISETPVPQPAPTPSLAERVAAKADEVRQEASAEEAPVSVDPDAPEDFELIAQDTNVLTAAQFQEMCEQHRIDPKYATAVRKQMWPDLKSWSEVTDEQRAQLMAEILRGSD